MIVMWCSFNLKKLGALFDGTSVSVNVAAVLVESSHVSHCSIQQLGIVL